MILTNILLTILVVMTIVKYLMCTFSQSDKEIEKPKIPTGTGQMPEEVLIGMINNANDSLDAHKVFTAKSLSELRNDLDSALYPALNSLIKMRTTKEYKKITKIIKPKSKHKKTKSKKYTDFQLHREIAKYIKRKDMGGMCKTPNLIEKAKDVPQISEHNPTLYKKLRTDAYQRIWQREKYNNKMNKGL